jgi:hypothetical protein
MPCLHLVSLIAIVLAAPACAAQPHPLLKPGLVLPQLDGQVGNPVAADVNRDGKVDLVVPAGKGLFVFLGDGKGFRPAPRSPLPLPAGGSEAVVADFDGDHNVDVALADHDSYDVTVLLGDGAGGFAPADGSPFAARRGDRPHTHGLAAGDFDNDGSIDLVTCNSSDNDVSILLNDGKARFHIAPRSPFPCGPSPYPFAVADLNRDSNLDVLVPNAVHHDNKVRTLTVLYGDGKGDLSPAPASPVRIAGPAFFVAAGDLNGDRAPDVVVTHDEVDTATVLLNDGRGGLSPSPASPLKLDHSSWCAEVIDMNGDGRNDVVLAGGDAVRVFLGDGNGRLTPAPGSPYRTGKGTWRFCVADFNGDRKPDVLTKCVEEKGRLVILLSQ